MMKKHHKRRLSGGRRGKRQRARGNMQLARGKGQEAIGNKQLARGKRQIIHSLIL